MTENNIQMKECDTCGKEVLTYNLDSGEIVGLVGLKAKQLMWVLETLMLGK